MLLNTRVAYLTYINQALNSVINKGETCISNNRQKYRNNKIYDPRIILKKEMYLKVPTINVP